MLRRIRTREAAKIGFALGLVVLMMLSVPELAGTGWQLMNLPHKGRVVVGSMTINVPWPWVAIRSKNYASVARFGRLGDTNPDSHAQFFVDPKPREREKWIQFWQGQYVSEGYQFADGPALRVAGHEALCIEGRSKTQPRMVRANCYVPSKVSFEFDGEEEDLARAYDMLVNLEPAP